GPKSHVAALIHLPLFVTAPDWFVLMSGAAVGLRGQRRFSRGAGAGAHVRLLRRAALIYFVHCALTFAVLCLNQLTGRLAIPDLTALGGPLRVAWLVATLQLQPAAAFMNILPIYVFLLVAAPLLLETMRLAGTTLV